MKIKRSIDWLSVQGVKLELVETDTGELAIIVPKWHGTDIEHTTPGTIWPKSWNAAMAWWLDYYAAMTNEVDPQRDDESDEERQEYLKHKSKTYRDWLHIHGGYAVMDGGE